MPAAGGALGSLLVLDLAAQRWSRPATRGDGPSPRFLQTLTAGLVSRDAQSRPIPKVRKLAHNLGQLQPFIAWANLGGCMGQLASFGPT